MQMKGYISYHFKNHTHGITVFGSFCNLLCCVIFYLEDLPTSVEGSAGVSGNIHSVAVSLFF